MRTDSAGFDPPSPEERYLIGADPADPTDPGYGGPLYLDRDPGIQHVTVEQLARGIRTRAGQVYELPPRVITAEGLIHPVESDPGGSFWVDHNTADAIAYAAIEPPTDEFQRVEAPFIGGVLHGQFLPWYTARQALPPVLVVRRDAQLYAFAVDVEGRPGRFETWHAYEPHPFDVYTLERDGYRVVEPPVRFDIEPRGRRVIPYLPMSYLSATGAQAMTPASDRDPEFDQPLVPSPGPEPIASLRVDLVSGERYYVAHVDLQGGNVSLANTELIAVVPHSRVKSITIAEFGSHQEHVDAINEAPARPTAAVTHEEISENRYGQEYPSTAAEPTKPIFGPGKIENLTPASGAEGGTKPAEDSGVAPSLDWDKGGTRPPLETAP